MTLQVKNLKTIYLYYDHNFINNSSAYHSYGCPMNRRQRKICTFSFPHLNGFKPMIRFQAGIESVVSRRFLDDVIFEECRMRCEGLITKSCPNLQD